MQSDINRLVDKPTPEQRLDPAATPDAIRSKTGLAPRQASRIDSTEVTVQSTDGLFTFIVQVVNP